MSEDNAKTSDIEQNSEQKQNRKYHKKQVVNSKKNRILGESFADLKGIANVQNVCSKNASPIKHVIKATVTLDIN